jgi:hypothetical protein
MNIFYPATDDSYVDVQPQVETDQVQVNDVPQTTNSNSRRQLRWNSLTKVKNKLTSLSKGMHCG